MYFGEELYTSYYNPAFMATDSRIAQLAQQHPIHGFDLHDEYGLVYSAYRGETYELCTSGRQLTQNEYDLVEPQWIGTSGQILALATEDGTEQHDLVTVDVADGSVSTLVDDEFVHNPVLRPRFDGQGATVGFAAVTDEGPGIKLYDIETGEDDIFSLTEGFPFTFDWNPSGDAIVYQLGFNEQTTIRVTDTESDRPLFDDPSETERLYTLISNGENTFNPRSFWSNEGILFQHSPNDYLNVAIAQASGSWEWLHRNERDTYAASWTADGGVLLFESNHGNITVRKWQNGMVNTIQSTGYNVTPRSTGSGDIGYIHTQYDNAGDVWHGSAPRTNESQFTEFELTAPVQTSYESFDGLEIPAQLYETDGKKAVVLAHGGPYGQNFTGYQPDVQVLTEHGYTVFAPDFRGSAGYGKQYRNRSTGDPGGKEVRDLAVAGEYLRSRGYENVAIYGGSYGGYLTLMALSQTDVWDGGVDLCGFFDLESFVENTGGGIREVMVRHIGGSPDEIPSFYRERSPSAHADKIDVPLFVIQGATDPRVPVTQAEQLVEVLEDNGIEHEYLCFENEGHGISRTENRIEAYGRMMEFLDDTLTV